MKTTKKFLCLLLFFTSINATYSKVNINETEKAINRKIDNALSLILSKNDYLTNIKIETEKVSNSKSQNSATQGSVNENLNEKEDYFLFRKLGLDSNVELEPQNLDKKELLEEKIKSIDVEVLLNDKLSKEVINSSTSILEKITFNGLENINLNTDRISLTVKEEKSNSVMETLAKFSTSIGFVLATLILSLVSFVLFNKYSDLSQGQTSAMIEANKEAAMASTQEGAFGAATSANENLASAISDNSDSTTSSNSDGTSNKESAIPTSVTRFTHFLDERQKDAISIIKRWLALMPNGSTEALFIIAQELNPESLVPLFEALSENERKTWKNSIGKIRANSNLEIGANFINQQILEEIIVPSNILDEEAKGLLYTLSVSECSSLINDNPELGPILFNTLASNYIAKVIPRLSDDIIQQITLASVEQSEEELKAQAGSLKEKLKQYHSELPATPFTDKITELLPFTTAENENYFFKAYAKTAPKDKVLQLLKHYVPVSVFPQLDEAVIKQVLATIPQKIFVESIVVMEEELSEKYLNILAPEGSKKREVLDIDIEGFQANDIELAKLQKRKDEILTQFINLSRQTIRNRPNLQEEIETSLEVLCEDYLGPNTDENNAQAA